MGGESKGATLHLCRSEDNLGELASGFRLSGLVAFHLLSPLAGSCESLLMVGAVVMGKVTRLLRVSDYFRGLDMVEDS